VKRFGVLLGKHAARVVGEQHIAPPVAIDVQEPNGPISTGGSVGTK